jgi:hypothetical protein
MVSDKSDRYKISCDYFEKWVYDTVSEWRGVHPALRSCTSSPAKGGMSKEDLRVEGKGFTLKGTKGVRYKKSRDENLDLQN